MQNGSKNRHLARGSAPRVFISYLNWFGTHDNGATSAERKTAPEPMFSGGGKASTERRRTDLTDGPALAKERQPVTIGRTTCLMLPLPMTTACLAGTLTVLGKKKGSIWRGACAAHAAAAYRLARMA